MSRVGGWMATASASNGIATASRGANGSRQHVIYGIGASFSGTVSAPVLLQIVDPDISPNTVLFEAYVSVGTYFQFPAGVCLPPGHNVSAIMGAGGSAIIGKVNLHGASV